MAMEEAGLRLVAEGSDSFVGALNDADAARGRFTDGLGQTAAKSGGFGQVITGALRKVGEIAVDAFMEAGQAAVGFVTDSIKVAGDFESGMNRFAAVTGDALGKSGLSLEDFRNQFLQLGKDTQYSAAEAEEAAINLAKGGIDPLTISSSGLKGVLDLAAAGELELGNASEIVAKQLGVWAETGVTGADVANLLAQAANASTVDVDDLALGLANAGGTAKTAGVSFQDLTTTMALIAPNFSSAADAGTSLKTFISRLIPTTDKQTAAMVALGLATQDGKSAFFDANGEFLGMEKAAQMLQGATKDLTQEQKLNVLQTIFGNDAIRAAAAIAEAGAEGYDAMATSMANAGTAADQAAKRQQGLNFAQEQLKGSMETLQIVLGSALIPLLTQFLNNVVTPGVNAILAFAQGFTDASDKGAFLQASLESLIPGAGQLVTVVQNVIAFLVALATSLQQPSDGMNRLAGIFSLAGDVIGGVVNGIWAVVSAIFGQVATFIAANGDEIQGFIDATWNTVLDIITLVLQLINATVVPALNAIAGFIAANGDQIQAFFQATWNMIEAIITIALAIIEGVIKAVLQLVQGDTAGALATLQATFNTVWEAIKQLVDAAIRQVQAVINLVLAALGTDVATLWGAIQTTIQTAVTNIQTGVSEGFETVRASIVGTIQNAIDGITGMLGDFYDKGKAIIESIVNGVNAIGTQIRDAVMGFVNGAVSEAISAINGAIAGIKNTIAGIWTTINDIRNAISSIHIPSLGNPTGGNSVKGATVQGVSSAAGLRAAASYNVSYSRAYNLHLSTGLSSTALQTQFAILESLA